MGVWRTEVPQEAPGAELFFIIITKEQD